MVLVCVLIVLERSDQRPEAGSPLKRWEVVRIEQGTFRLTVKLNMWVEKREHLGRTHWPG